MLVSDVVAAAMQQLGVVAMGEQPTGIELQTGIRELNWMLKTWATSRGVNLWRETQGSADFPANTATVTLDPQPIDVIEARFVQSDTFERPLQRWESGQYEQLPNKAQPGYPTAFSIQKNVGGVTMTLWPVPYADSTVLYTYSRVPDDVTDGAQTIDIPQAWLETVYLALAARMVSLLGVNRIDPATASLVTQRAAGLEQLLLSQDQPASVFMGPWEERYF
jgi:hypothetical protein